MNMYQTKIISGGRITIPSQIRKKLNWKDGSTLLIEEAGSEIRIKSVREGIHKARTILGTHSSALPPYLSNELIAERKREAQKEGK
jgi:AbrB family looped-hinge helix DNA binding protein